VEFQPGINIIVGANNSGKTAFLEGLSLNFKNHIHKTIKTFPLASDVINSYSSYQLSLSVDKKDIQRYFDISDSHNNFIIPIPDRYKENFSRDSLQCHESLNIFLNNEKPQKDIEIQIRVSASGTVIPFDSIPDFFSSVYTTPVKKILTKNELLVQQTYFGFFKEGSDKKNIRTVSLTDTIQHQIFQKYRNIIYKFNAERLSSGTSPSGISRVLKADASNLAQVLLNLLAGNPDLFKEFNDYVSTVIPSIKWVSALPDVDNTVQIKIWTFDKAKQRLDLTYPLSDCGTGVSQVLAILYVIITSTEPQIIIVDEPQSFLHPEAAKKLIEIFKEFPQHQYFIATHSSEIITAANPSTIVKLRYEDCETKAFLMNSKNIEEQRDLLYELGVRLSDLFGADEIVWVEGPTEEQCFPIILEKIAKKPQGGIQFLAVKSTSDLLEVKSNKSIQIAFDVYNQLSKGKSLFPPAIGFIFDSELRDNTQKDKLKTQLQIPVHFLERRMYENYLLHPQAIADIINAAIINDDNKHEIEPLSHTRVLEWINDARNETCYFQKDPTQLSDSEWLCEVNGSKFLENLFSELSGGLINFKYNKVKYSRKITVWLIDNEPKYLFPLSEFLVKCLSKKTK
jgi:AAA15 family ATPase/GTPase